VLANQTRLAHFTGIGAAVSLVNVQLLARAVLASQTVLANRSRAATIPTASNFFVGRLIGGDRGGHRKNCKEYEKDSRFRHCWLQEIDAVGSSWSSRRGKV
jgi:hypothetical protein